jgi:hypothetical protein
MLDPDCVNVEVVEDDKNPAEETVEAWLKLVVAVYGDAGIDPPNDVPSSPSLSLSPGTEEEVLVVRR